MNPDAALPAFRLERGARLAQAQPTGNEPVTPASPALAVMTELGALDAIDYARLKSAAVGNAVATLQRLGRDRLLVVEAATAQAPRRVRGMISRSQIEETARPGDQHHTECQQLSEIERALV